MALLTDTNPIAPSGPRQTFYRERNGGPIVVALGTPADVSPDAGTPQALEPGTHGKIYQVLFIAKRNNAAIGGGGQYEIQLDGVSQSDPQQETSGAAAEVTGVFVMGMVRAAPGAANVLTILCTALVGNESVEARDIMIVEVGEGQL